MPRPADILLVEDNPADVRLLQEALRETEGEILLRIADDGEEAMEMLILDVAKGKLPDLVVLDLNLPRKCGREVLSEIKAHPQLKRIPVVVLTTSDSPDDIAHVYEQSGNCYIQKPVEFARFLEVVRSMEHFWMQIVLLPTKLPAREP